MKLLPTQHSARRVLNGDDALGQGMEAAVMLALFLGLGWLIDRWLGTTPWFMIAMFLFAAVGMFMSMKARYLAKMEAHDEERRQAAASGRPTTAVPQ